MDQQEALQEVGFGYTRVMHRLKIAAFEAATEDDFGLFCWYIDGYAVYVKITLDSINADRRAKEQ